MFRITECTVSGLQELKWARNIVTADTEAEEASKLCYESNPTIVIITLPAYEANSAKWLSDFCDAYAASFFSVAANRSRLKMMIIVMTKGDRVAASTYDDIKKAAEQASMSLVELPIKLDRARIPVLISSVMDKKSVVALFNYIMSSTRFPALALE